MALVYCFGDNPLADSQAKEAAEALVAAYPNHSWWVECKGGALIVKHFAISGTIGMVLHCSKMAHSAAARKSSVLEAAGELLERAGLRRGDYQGEMPDSFEGPARLKWKRPLLKIPVIH